MLPLPLGLDPLLGLLEHIELVVLVVLQDPVLLDVRDRVLRVSRFRLLRCSHSLGTSSRHVAFCYFLVRINHLNVNSLRNLRFLHLLSTFDFVLQFESYFGHKSISVQLLWRFLL